MRAWNPSDYTDGWTDVRIFWIAQNIKTTLTIQESRGKIPYVRWSRQRLRSGMQRQSGWKIKKLLTSLDEYAILNKLSREGLLHNSKKEIKKVVDKHETLWYNIKAVAWNGNNKKNIDNWTIDNKPWKFLQEIFQERTSKDVKPEQ